VPCALCTRHCCAQQCHSTQKSCAHGTSHSNGIDKALGQCLMHKTCAQECLVLCSQDVCTTVPFHWKVLCTRHFPLNCTDQAPRPSTYLLPPQSAPISCHACPSQRPWSTSPPQPGWWACRSRQVVLRVRVPGTPQGKILNLRDEFCVDDSLCQRLFTCWA